MKGILKCPFRIPYPLTSSPKIPSWNTGKILTQKYQVDSPAINEGAALDEHLKELEEILDNIIVYPFQKGEGNRGK